VTNSHLQDTNSPIAHRKVHVASIVFLTLIIFLAVGLRVYRANESLWVDELHTSWTVSNGVGSVADRAAMGNQSPFYFYMTWCSTSLFGSSELTIRMPSLVAGVLLVPLMYVAVFRWTSSFVAALLAGFLVAIDREFIFYAQEARPYAVVQLLGLVSVTTFSHLVMASRVKGEKRASSSIVWRILFIISSVLLFYSHYTAGLLIVAEICCYLVLLTTRELRPAVSWKCFTTDILIVTLLCLPAAPHLIDIATRRNDWQGIIDAGTTPTLLRIFDTYLLLPTAIVALTSFISWIQRRRAIFDRMDFRVLIILICWFIVPPGTTWLATVIGTLPVFMFRYVIVSAAAAIALACALTAIVHAKTRWVAGLAVAVGAVWTSGIVQQLQANGRIIGSRNEDWINVVRIVNANDDGKSWPVLLQAGLIEDRRLKSDNSELFHDYCLFPITSLYSIDTSHELVPLPSGCAPDVDELIFDEAGIWLIVRGRADYAKAIASGFCKNLTKDQRPCKMHVRFTEGSLHLFEFASSDDD